MDLNLREEILTKAAQSAVDLSGMTIKSINKEENTLIVKYHFVENENTFDSEMMFDIDDIEGASLEGLKPFIWQDLPRAGNDLAAYALSKYINVPYYQIIDEADISTFYDSDYIFDIEYDGNRYRVVLDEDEAEEVAEKIIKQYMEDDPAGFGEELHNYLYMTNTDRRLKAQDMADSYIRDMRDEDVIEYMDAKDEIDEFDNRIYEIEDEAAEGYEERVQQIEEEKQNRIDALREEAEEKYYDEIYKALGDPLEYFVNQQGIYTAEELMDQSFINVDYEEAVKGRYIDWQQEIFYGEQGSEIPGLDGVYVANV